MTALDPDQRAIDHSREVVGVSTICADFMQADIDEKFDVITFNKVLEHIEDPISMLTQSKKYLKEGGFVYVELPDGEVAAQDGANREEFTIDHIHVFSLTSQSLLADSAGYTTISIERLKEPSTKYTLRSFLRLDL